MSGRLSRWWRPYVRPSELAVAPSSRENKTTGAITDAPADRPATGAIRPAAKTTQPRKVMRNGEIATAGESRNGVGSESGNVRKVHGCLRMRPSFEGVVVTTSHGSATRTTSSTSRHTHLDSPETRPVRLWPRSRWPFHDVPGSGWLVHAQQLPSVAPKCAARVPP
jgi:hypothetical protein